MTSRGRDKQNGLIQLADSIRQLGLASPAAMLLEAGQPFALLAAQLVWLSQPILTLLFSQQQVDGTAEILEDPESVRDLIGLLSREPTDSGDNR